MSKNKRMIYIWDENLEFYDSLQNKSDFINRLMANAKEAALSEAEFRQKDAAWQKDQNAPEPKVGIDDPSHPDWSPDPRIREIRRAVYIMEERDQANVDKSRGNRTA